MSFNLRIVNGDKVAYKKSKCMFRQKPFKVKTFIRALLWRPFDSQFNKPDSDTLVMQHAAVN